MIHVLILDEVNVLISDETYIYFLLLLRLFFVLKDLSQTDQELPGINVLPNSHSSLDTIYSLLSCSFLYEKILLLNSWYRNHTKIRLKESTYFTDINCIIAKISFDFENNIRKLKPQMSLFVFLSYLIPGVKSSY